ncbi:phosphoglycerate mutase-like protein [Meredithblackwellia eburnea MCA 4105]
MATTKVILFTRHAQAEHNVGERYHIPDAPLTTLGRQQSAELQQDTKDTFQLTADLLVSSPLRRPLQTTLVAYPVLRERLGTIIILPELQETNDFPCDTGSSREDLEADPEFSGLDFSNLTPEWTSKQGIFDPDNVRDRAKWVRRWLRDRPEKEIVVVAHGDILREITGGGTRGGISWEPWANAQVKSFSFKHENDDEALLTPVNTDLLREGSYVPTSSQIY